MLCDSQQGESDAVDLKRIFSVPCRLLSSPYTPCPLPVDLGVREGVDLAPDFDRCTVEEPCRLTDEPCLSISVNYWLWEWEKREEDEEGVCER